MLLAVQVPDAFRILKSKGRNFFFPLRAILLYSSAPGNGYGSAGFFERGRREVGRDERIYREAEDLREDFRNIHTVNSD